MLTGLDMDSPPFSLAAATSAPHWMTPATDVGVVEAARGGGVVVCREAKKCLRSKKGQPRDGAGQIA